MADANRVAGVVLAAMIGAGALSVPALLYADPNCVGLECNDPSDCGSLCFCNKPYDDRVGYCFEDC